MRNKIKEIFELQNKLNMNTNGKNWINGITKENRKILWKRCIYMEACEAIDSFPAWKHWKDIYIEPDFDNLFVEVVDVFHFLASDVIESKRSVEDAINKFMFAYEDKPKRDGVASNEEIILLLEELAKSAINGKTPIYEFLDVVEAIPNFDFNDVYLLYIGKNCLNQFRQDNGYKDGTYKKLWSGRKEDNVFMQRYTAENPNTTYQELYDYLKLEYKKA